MGVAKMHVDASVRRKGGEQARHWVGVQERQ